MRIPRYVVTFMILAPIVVGACASDMTEGAASGKILTRRAVADGIKTTARGRGITNALLLAGIGNHETNLAHCVDDYYIQKCMQAEDTPRSQSCRQTSVTIGNADSGGCVQGGMGVFQIDAGTQEDTIAKYGATVVELDGNTNIAIDHVLADLAKCTDAPNLGSDPQAAIAWMNGIQRGSADYDHWFQCIAKHYNGCLAANGCNQNARADQYKTSTEALVSDFGEGYWST